MSRKVQHTDVVYSVMFYPDSFCSTVLKLSPRKQVFDIYFMLTLKWFMEYFYGNVLKLHLVLVFVLWYFFNDKKPVSSQLTFKVYVVHSLKCT